MISENQRRAWRAEVAAFQTPSVSSGVGQLASTVLPYIAIVAVMYVMVGVSVWLTLALAVPAAGFVVRAFIIQHDCGHGSFFRSSRANAAIGRLCSVITMTPFDNWRRQHANHHAVWNNLDRRGSQSDIYSNCRTVEEYSALSPFRRWLFRAIRHPSIAQIILPPLVFLLLYRIPFDTPRSWRRERISVYLTNAGIALVLGSLLVAVGAWPVIIVQLPIMVMASIAGVWLFSVQHRFEHALWTRNPEWDATSASLHGSSFLRLPRLLRWFTGNIGFHHLHHLSPRVPNYRLAACHTACPRVSGMATELSLWQALRAPAYALWDESLGRMVKFSEV